MKKVCIFLLLILSLAPSLTHAQSNAGFVPGNIWYSKDPFFESDKIKIYTVLFNPDQREFSGTVRFFDKTTLLGKKDFILAPRTVKDISIDWTATVGEHTIFAKIENAKFLVSAGKYEEVYLSGNQTEESQRTVSKKVVDKEGADINTTEKIIDKSTESIASLGKLIEEKTPDSIAKPIIATANMLESWRARVGDASQNSKVEIKKELEVAKGGSAAGKLGTPFNYIKLFFFTLASFIFNNKFVFYGLGAGIIFFILRYLWRLVFHFLNLIL